MEKNGKSKTASSPKRPGKSRSKSQVKIDADVEMNSQEEQDGSDDNDASDKIVRRKSRRTQWNNSKDSEEEKPIV